MDETLRALEENIAAFDDIDSPLATTIADELDDLSVEDVTASLEALTNAVSSVQEAIYNDNGLDDVYADGLNDGLGAVTSQVDLAAGQLSVTARVIKAGAGRHKAAEYIENAVEATGEANEHLDSLNEYVNDHAADPSEVNEAVERAEQQLNTLEEALETTRDALK